MIMKDGMDSAAVGRAPEPEFANRKLIRPTLPRHEHRERGERPMMAAAGTAKKTPPPEQTHAENYYYQKQMQAKTPMVIVLQDGESLNGVIEWYDRNCLKIVRNGGPNMVIYKQAIRYMYKAAERTNG
jgi:sRNA-binding regulator protein Hfq